MERKHYSFEDHTTWQRFWGHLGTILRHKYFVAGGCFRIGLYRQGILHDLSKFSPTEFIPGVKYYDGHRSPNSIERELYGCSTAWLHHKGRNKHHFEYWLDFSPNPKEGIIGCKMPMRYVAEMICDRRAACKAYNGTAYTPADPWSYYVRTRHRAVMHPDTRAVLEYTLVLMRDQGEEAAFAYVRKLLAITKGFDYTAAKLGLSYTPLQ